jgi:hypothetical protein
LWDSDVHSFLQLSSMMYGDPGGTKKKRDFPSLAAWRREEQPMGVGGAQRVIGDSPSRPSVASLARVTRPPSRILQKSHPSSPYSDASWDLEPRRHSREVPKSSICGGADRRCRRQGCDAGSACAIGQWSRRWGAWLQVPCLILLSSFVSSHIKRPFAPLIFSQTSSHSD